MLFGGIIMTVKDIIDIIEEFAPRNLACEWDHIGLMTGSYDREVKHILTCLELTQDVLDEAIDKKCDLIISHHPFIYSPLKDLTENDNRGSLIAKVIRSNIVVYSAHTNLDFANGGVNDVLATTLGLVDVHSDESGMHRYGFIKSMNIEEFCEVVAKKLHINGVKYIESGKSKFDNKVHRIGISCGSFDGITDWLIKENIDVLVTGEVKYHDAVNLRGQTFYTVVAGHFETEIFISKALAGVLCEKISKKNSDVYVDYSVSEKSPFLEGLNVNFF